MWEILGSIVIPGFFIAIFVVAGLCIALWPIVWFIGGYAEMLDDVEANKAHARKRDLESRVLRLMPDQYGNGGIVAAMGKGGDIQYRSLDTLASFSQQIDYSVKPILEMAQKQNQLLQKLVHQMPPNILHDKRDMGAMLTPAQPAELESQAVELGTYTLDQLMAKHNFSPRLHNILIGETVNDDGAIVPLTLDFPQSVHVLCSGSSGLGKSTLCEAMALELASVPNVDLCAVDYGSGTFDALANHMRYQIADQPEIAIALFQELIKICNQRKEMYKAVDRARSLDQFNAKSGENLPYVFCFVDETSALLDHDGTRQNLITLARMGRKYGIGLCLSGTELPCKILPSEARGNCQARIAFWLEAGLSRSMFNSDCATQLHGVGEIVVKKPGTVGILQGKTPKVTLASYNTLPKPTGTQETLQPIQPDEIKTIQELDDETLSENDRIVVLHNAGFSNSAIADQIFGYQNGRTTQKVKDAIASNV